MSDGSQGHNSDTFGDDMGLWCKSEIDLTTPGECADDASNHISYLSVWCAMRNQPHRENLNSG